MSRQPETIETEINTNVPDKEDRKRLRKKRIDRRGAVDETEVQETSKGNNGMKVSGMNKVTEALYHLDLRKHKGLQDVTSIRLATDNAEAKRRAEDDDLRRERLGKLQHEALASAKANAAVEMKWAELFDKETPQELYHDIQAQMAACAAIIRSKDDLIADFQKQLRAKDEEYVRTLRQQAADIDELLKRIRREFTELQGEYDRELDSIEQGYLEERASVIAAHTAEIEAMFEHRRNKEVHYKDAKMKREEQYQKDVEDLITKGANQYNKLKIELEMNIQTLKQQLEEIRATYQLNTEKLDYNYRVLTEFDVEKNAELARYKRRLTKLKDQLNQLITKYTELETSDSKMNSELTSDYRSLTRKYKDLQAKFRHFEVADTSKYDEMWAMHEDEAKDMVDQLLKADKIITEQQMGWLWKAPDMHALQKVLGRHGSLGMAAQAGAAQDEDDAEGGGGGGVGGGGANKTKRPGEGNSEADLAIRRTAAARMRGMLRMLASEAGFLLNPQVQQSLADMSEDDATLAKAETMLKTLGVKSEDRLNSLVNYFFCEPGDGRVGDSVGGEEELEAELMLHHAADDVNELKNMINPEDVISAVKAYMEEVAVEGNGGSGPVSTKAKEEDERIRLKRLQSMQNYWIQLSQVVSDPTVDVWKQMERYSVNLRELLIKRSSSIAEVDALSAKNAELKKLLNQYLSDPNINGALQVPPAQVMRVRNTTSLPKGNEQMKTMVESSPGGGGGVGGVPHGGGASSTQRVPGKKPNKELKAKILLSQTH